MKNNLGVIKIGVQFGRVRFGLIGLGIFGVSVGIGVIFGYIYIRERAEYVAAKMTEQIIPALHKEWTKKELPKIVASMVGDMKELESKQVTDDDANQIAAATDDDGPEVENDKKQ